MGLVTCILFAVIATWVTVSIQNKWRPKSLVLFFIIGIASGSMGCLAGIIAGWGDLDKFNLISVFISIAMVVPVAFVMSRFTIFYPSQKTVTGNPA